MSSVWTNVFIVMHVVVALAIIGLVLLQHGKGADMGSGFGGGSSGSLFGATGSANFLSRATAVLATIFFLLSLLLAYLATNRGPEPGGVMDAVRQQQQKPAAAPAGKPSAEVPAPAVPAGEQDSKPQGANDRAVPQ